MAIRPMIKGAVVHKKFFRDMGKDQQKVDSIVKLILDCSNLEFHELHKFEKNVDDNLIFRAKKEHTHFVYCINKKHMENIFFLRAISNFTEYKHFLDNEKQIKRMATELTT